MTTLESLESWAHRLKISIIRGPSREELFDALRLVSERRKLEFTFLVKDERKELSFLNAYGYPVEAAEVTLKALTLGIELPEGFPYDNWKVRVALLIRFCEVSEDLQSSGFFNEWVEVGIHFNTLSRKGRPVNMSGSQYNQH